MRTQLRSIEQQDRASRETERAAAAMVATGLVNTVRRKHTHCPACGEPFAMSRRQSPHIPKHLWFWLGQDFILVPLNWTYRLSEWGAAWRSSMKSIVTCAGSYE